jgi:hypothetical protein
MSRGPVCCRLVQILFFNFLGFIMTVRPVLIKFALLFSFVLGINFAVSGNILYAAENFTMRSINNGTGSLSPEQIQQMMENATPEQIQQILENAPAKKRIPPYETIYKVEEPEQVSEDLDRDIAIEKKKEKKEKVFSATEQLYRQKYASTLAESLEQFGYSIFDSSTDTLSNLAVPRDDYLIGPGDKLFGVMV